MAKKGFIKDLNNIEILPITRGELVLDSSGKQALHSNEFLATNSLPGLMSKEDKAKLDKLNENGTTIGLVSVTTDGLAPKIGTEAASTVTTQADEWVLTSTKGATPTWRKLPTNAFLNYYRPILVNGTSLLGNNNTALNIAAGTNINLTTDAGKVTINNGLTKVSQLTNDSGYLTSASLNNYVTLHTDLTITGIKTFKLLGKSEYTLLSSGNVRNGLSTNGGWAREVSFSNSSGNTEVTARFGVYGWGVNNDSNRNYINYLYLAHDGQDYGTATFKVHTDRATILNNIVLHAGNYNNYAPKLDGTGAIGDWNIDITGNAVTADKLKTTVQLWGNDFDGSNNILNASIDLWNNNFGYQERWSRFINAKNGSTNYLGQIGFYGIGKQLIYTFVGGVYSAPHMIIDSIGNVGIGTTDPKSRLDVNGVILSKGIVIGNEINYAAKNTDGKDIGLMYLSSSNNLIIGKGVSDNNSSTYVHGNSIIFRSKGGVIDLTMSISNHGNVTIGNSNLAGTTYKLYVDGSTNINGSLTASTFLGNLDWSYITNKPSYDDRFPTLGHGVEIPKNADLNTETYLNKGNYYCRTINISKTLQNCPVQQGFLMSVYYLGNYVPTSTYLYRVRKITTHQGEEWIQEVHSAAISQVYTYGPWKKTARTDDTYPTNQITALTDYAKATSASDLVTTDTLNIALGKLEYKAGIAYSWYRTITEDDTDEIINKWDEVVDFVNNLEVDLTDEFVTRKTELIITGKKTFSGSYKGALIIHRSDKSDGNSVINFSNASKTLGYIGVSGSAESMGEGHPIFVNETRAYKIWHEGNDGAGSGLDTDLFLGNTITSFFKEYSLINSESQFKERYRTFGNFSLSLYSPVVNEYRYGLILNFVDSRQTTQFFIPDNQGTLYFRSEWNAFEKDAEWFNTTAVWYEIITSKTIKDQIVSSANKLTNKVKLWGNDFDGTLDVYQDLMFNHSYKILWRENTYADAFAIYPEFVGVGDYNKLIIASSVGDKGVEPTLTPKIAILGQSGNVGIGVLSPTLKLHVNGTVKATSYVGTNIRIECDKDGILGNKYNEINNYTDTLDLNYSSSTAMSLCVGGGNVGIGTRTPTQKLEVVGHTILNGNVGIGTTDISYPLNVQGSTNLKGKVFVRLDASMAIYSEYNSRYTADWGKEVVAILTAFDNLDPITSKYPTSHPTRCVLALQPRGGFIGIGTTSPADKVEINGGDKSVTIKTTAVDALKLCRTQAGGSFIVYYPDNHTDCWRVGAGTGNSLAMILYINSLEIYRLYINNSGNVGIGTTSPNLKLSVIGNVYSSDYFLVMDSSIAGVSTGFFNINYNDAWTYRIKDTDGTTVKDYKIPHYGHTIGWGRYIHTNGTNLTNIGSFISDYFGLKFHVGSAGHAFRFGCASGDSLTWGTTLYGDGRLRLQLNIFIDESKSRYIALGGSDIYTWIDSRDSSNNVKNNIVMYDNETVVLNLRPKLHNTYNLGTTSYRWANVCSVLGNFSGEVRLEKGYSVVDGTISNQLLGTFANNDYWAIGVGATANDAGFVEFRTGDNGNEPIYFAQLSGSTVKNRITLMNASGNTELKSLTASGEIISSNSDAFRLSYGDYGVIHRNDGGAYHILLTDEGKAATGAYNALRPLYIELKTGHVHVGTALFSNNVITGKGFSKLNSSDSYVLLGGGGHKALSDFMLKSDELTNNLTTITKELTVTQDWMDTGISGTDLTTGTYIIQVIDSYGFRNFCSGVVSWYSENTNDLISDEIVLHCCGYAYALRIYLRTQQTSSGSGGMKLLIAANKNLTASTYTFKFKRII